MTTTTITAGGASDSSVLGSGNDGTLVIQTGPTGSKVNAVSIDATGKVSFPQNQSGSAPFFSARAWAYFNGATTGTNAPAAGGNVTSVTRNSAGNYTINFTTAMPDTNFAVGAMAAVGAGNAWTQYESSTTARTVSSVTIVTGNSNTGAAGDSNFVSVVIFR